MLEMTDHDFERIRRFIHARVGVNLTGKKALASRRLESYVAARQLGSYGAFADRLEGGAPVEVQAALDLLTTNETYFFREPKHFEKLQELAREGRRGLGALRIWSAAASSGEEAYSIAMVLAAELGARPWGVLGTDISERVLAQARAAQYPLARATHIAPDYLKRFCRRGVGPADGLILVKPEIRTRVEFRPLNLVENLPSFGRFDVAFLRNVLIYFDAETKQQVVRRVLGAVRPGGLLFVGHADSLSGYDIDAEALAPSIYRRHGS